MSYELRCDVCDFDRRTEAEADAYTLARDHESDHPTHFVFIHSERRQPESALDR